MQIQIYLVICMMAALPRSIYFNSCLSFQKLYKMSVIFVAIIMQFFCIKVYSHRYYTELSQITMYNGRYKHDSVLHDVTFLYENFN